MINLNKHTVQIGAGDVDVNVLSSPGGNPILAFTPVGANPTPSNSIFLGFSSAESIDNLISVLRAVKKKYYAAPELSHTQQFRIYTED
ncbi:MAG: hypothetical protein IJV40_15910 [Oscillospiraceae bacterium]|nr:hypothetical protein [Oscillospiraceae bacterium]